MLYCQKTALARHAPELHHAPCGVVMTSCTQHMQSHIVCLACLPKARKLLVVCQLPSTQWQPVMAVTSKHHCLMHDCMLHACQWRADLLSPLQSTGPSGTNAMQSHVKHCSLIVLCLHMSVQAAFYHAVYHAVHADAHNTMRVLNCNQFSEHG